jgi:putative FmdB family regulatory protein
MEALRKLSDDPLKDCPNCGKPELAKQLTAAAFKLKGTGWYETDFKNSGKKEADKVDGGDKTSGDGEKKPPAKDSATKDSGSSKAGSTDAGKSSGSKTESSSS